MVRHDRTINFQVIKPNNDLVEPIVIKAIQKLLSTVYRLLFSVGLSKSRVFHITQSFFSIANMKILINVESILRKLMWR